jgi:hypothetical protein
VSAGSALGNETTTDKKASGYTLVTLTVLKNLKPSGDGRCIENGLYYSLGMYAI